MCVGGRLETGYIQNGDRLMLMPQGDIATVKGNYVYLFKPLMNLFQRNVYLLKQVNFRCSSVPNFDTITL